MDLLVRFVIVHRHFFPVISLGETVIVRIMNSRKKKKTTYSMYYRCYSICITHIRFIVQEQNMYDIFQFTSALIFDFIFLIIVITQM